jgi:uncharacterized protein
MRWSPGGKSSDIDDLRGQSAGGFGGGGMRIGGGLGIGGVILLLILSAVTGTDLTSFLGAGSDPTAPAPAPSASGDPGYVSSSPEEERLVQFVSFVLDDAQRTWDQVLGNRYQHTRLVLFRDAVNSACGFAESATGPFYCPRDHRVYIDLGFYDELKRRFGAPGEFAQAYVLTHEIGHHVQSLLGTEARVRQVQQQDPRAANELSVRLELQADCYAGIWGHSTSQRNLLEQGDVEAGLNAAAAIGDDRIQRMSGSRVAPERWTHGSSAQRVEWFKRGLQSGRVDACDTFGR